MNNQEPRQSRPESRPQSKQHEEPIRFLPITEGLGFHPFSDGLPYAPLAKNPLGSGTGAVSAGPPRVAPNIGGSPVGVTPKVRVPQIDVPVAKPVVKTEAAASSLASIPISASSGSQVTSGAQINSKARDLPPAWSYLPRRTAAYLLDSIVSVLGCAAILWGMLWKQEIDQEILYNSSVIFVTGLLFVAAHWIFLTVQEIAFGTSIGKRVFGFYLAGGGVRIFLRSIFYFVSLFSGVGLLWALFDRKRRCLHDVLTDVHPVDLTRVSI